MILIFDCFDTIVHSKYMGKQGQERNILSIGWEHYPSTIMSKRKVWLSMDNRKQRCYRVNYVHQLDAAPTPGQSVHLSGRP